MYSLNRLRRSRSAAICRLKTATPRSNPRTNSSMFRVNLDRLVTDLERLSRPILEAGSVPNVHPAAAQLLVTAKGQGPTAYRGAILAVRGLAERRAAAQRCRDLDQRLREAAPLVTEALRNLATCKGLPKMSSRIGNQRRSASTLVRTSPLPHVSHVRLPPCC